MDSTATDEPTNVDWVQHVQKYFKSSFMSRNLHLYPVKYSPPLLQKKTHDDFSPPKFKENTDFTTIFLAVSPGYNCLCFLYIWQREYSFLKCSFQSAVVGMLITLITSDFIFQ